VHVHVADILSLKRIKLTEENAPFSNIKSLRFEKCNTSCGWSLVVVVKCRKSDTCTAPHAPVLHGQKSPRR
jgi:hypothetical protein